MPPKPTWHAQANELAAEGLTPRQIADKLEKPYSTVHSMLTGYNTDPDTRARKRAYDRRVAKKRNAKLRKLRQESYDQDPGIPGLIPIYHFRVIIDFARVDIADWPELTQRRFHSAAGYASTSIDRKSVYLHHLLLGPMPRGSGRECDHRNRDKLDNRRSNLRVVTRAENCANRGGRFERHATAA